MYACSCMQKKKTILQIDKFGGVQMIYLDPRRLPEAVPIAPRRRLATAANARPQAKAQPQESS